MDTKALASGIVGFLLGGLVVSTAAALEEDEKPDHGSQMRMSRTIGVEPVPPVGLEPTLKGF